MRIVTTKCGSGNGGTNNNIDGNGDTTGRNERGDRAERRV